MAPPLAPNYDYSATTQFVAGPQPAIVRKFSVQPGQAGAMVVFVCDGPSTFTVSRRAVRARSDASAQFRKEFRRLAREWHQETDHLSTLPAVVLNDHYQRIMTFGERALPHILRDLLRTRNHNWLWALEKITGEDPAMNASSPREAVDAWHQWGESRLA